MIESGLELTRRTGWPADLRTLLERYPREVWPTHGNLGQTARFWLHRHAMFRELGEAMRSGTALYREGQVALPAFRSWMAPRLGYFLSDLHAHHQIEDFNYFPVFRAAAPELVRGFQVLDNDHASSTGPSSTWRKRPIYSCPRRTPTRFAPLPTGSATPARRSSPVSCAILPTRRI